MLNEKMDFFYSINQNDVITYVKKQIQQNVQIIKNTIT